MATIGDNKYTFLEYFDVLDWELEQVKDGIDRASADKFRYLPSTQAPRVINETIRELVALCPKRFEKEIIFRFHHNLPAGRKGIVVLVEFGADYLYSPAFLVLDDLGNAVDFRDNRLAFGGSGFKELLYPGQTAGNIKPDHTTGMEGAQSELGAGFADTLGGNDADSDVIAHQTSAGEVTAVASLAGAAP